MRRRTFAELALGAAAGASFGVPHPLFGRSHTSINGERLLERFHSLAEFGRTPAGGISRTAYSDADLAARAVVRSWMNEAGLTVSVDFAGNLIGRKEAAERGLAPLMIGSHIDSVPGGGNFDGQVGSVGAVEVAAALHDSGFALRHALEVVVFPNEEGGKTGSRALAGEVRPFELQRMTASGFTIGDGTRRIGGDPDRIQEVRRDAGSVSGFFELHIEQGGVLESRGIEIGVVEGIVGIRRWTATITGVANHAGTTPMDARRDAMIAAAELVLAVNRVATGREGSQVGTVGMIEAHPGAPNVVPGEVQLSVEFRDLEMATIDELFIELRGEADAIAEASDVAIHLEEFYVSYAAPTEERFRLFIEAGADARGLTRIRMPSGAGHDAQSIARLGPIGMIFVPSVDGVSHSPNERTADQDVVNGTEVLLEALLAADASEA